MNTMILKIDTSVYPMEAVQAAAYAMTDRVYARVARGKGSEASVTLKVKKGGDGARLLEDEFFNELLHQALRIRVSESNRKIREYVVTKALVSAQVAGAPPLDAAPEPAPDAECPECAAEARAQGGQAASPPVDAELEKEIEKLLAEIEKSGPSTEDPLGVAVPWEEKHGLAKGRQVPGGAGRSPLAGGEGAKSKAAKPARAGKAAKPARAGKAARAAKGGGKKRSA